AVFGMIDDPCDLLGKQPRIDGVVDRADAEDAVPGFEMAPRVPGQRGDAVAGADPVAVEPLGKLERPRANFSIAGGVDGAFDRARDHAALRVLNCGMVDDAMA